MDCSCRTAALRIFVRSIAQIHVPARTATPRLAQTQALYYSRPSRLCGQRPIAALATAPARALHSSSARDGAAAAAQAPDDGHAESASKQDGTAEVTEQASREPQAPSAVSSPAAKSQEAATDRSSATPRKEETGDRGDSGKSEKKKKKQQKLAKPESKDEGEEKPRRKKEPWMIQKEALKKKFPEGWKPRKRLSPDALIGIRALHKQFPDEYPTEVLAEKFEVSPEAIRRILKSKWTPTPEEEEERQERWYKRGKKVWAHWAALGKKPPRKWRAEGIVRDPYWNRPRGPTDKDKEARAEAQRKLAENLLG